MNIDSMLKRIIGKNKHGLSSLFPHTTKALNNNFILKDIKQNYAKVSRPFFNMTNPNKILGSASIAKQKQWKTFSPKKKMLLRKRYKDSDNDRVPDKWDCQPYNTMRQDGFEKPVFVPMRDKKAFSSDTRTAWRKIGENESGQPIIAEDIYDFPLKEAIKIMNSNMFTMEEKEDMLRKQGASEYKIKQAKLLSRPRASYYRVVKESDEWEDTRNNVTEESDDEEEDNEQKEIRYW
jgi:hypothetical protein